MWYRIFSASEIEPRPDAILTQLNQFAAVQGHFHGDADGWFHADILCDDKTLSLDRYTADEEGIRAELSTWAAYVEVQGGAEHTPLMERLIQTKQLFALDGPEDGVGHSVCVALCEYLSRTIDGIYHLDGSGFYFPGGALLLREG
jgi:hypothetical protein